MLDLRHAIATATLSVFATCAVAQSNDTGEASGLTGLLAELQQKADAEAAAVEAEYADRPALTDEVVAQMLVAHPTIIATQTDAPPPESEERAEIMMQGVADMRPYSAFARAMEGSETLTTLDEIAAAEGYADYAEFAGRADHMRQIGFSQWMVAYSNSLNFGAENDEAIPNLPAFIADESQDPTVRETLAQQLAEMYDSFAIRDEDAAIYNESHAELHAIFAAQ